MNATIPTTTRAFRDLCQIEPRLFSLWMEASTFRAYPPNRYCANRVWAQHFKPELDKLAGQSAAHPDMRSELYLDIATVNIQSSLPECDHDGMCW